MHCFRFKCNFSYNPIDFSQSINFFFLLFSKSRFFIQLFIRVVQNYGEEKKVFSYYYYYFVISLSTVRKRTPNGVIVLAYSSSVVSILSKNDILDGCLRVQNQRGLGKAAMQGFSLYKNSGVEKDIRRIPSVFLIKTYLVYPLDC